MDDRHVYAQLLLKFFIPIMKNDTFFFRPETNDWPFCVLGKAGRKILLLMLQRRLVACSSSAGGPRPR